MLRKLVRSLRRVPDAGPPADLARIAAALRAGDMPWARQALADHLAHNPHDAGALHLEGIALLGEGRIGQAVDALSRAHALEPEEPVYLANLGLAIWRQGRPDLARPYLDKVRRLSPDMVEPMLNLSHVCLELGDVAAARAALEECLRHATRMPGPDAARLWLVLAGLSPMFADIDAVDCLRRARALDSGSRDIPLQGYMAFASRCDWDYPLPALKAFLEAQGAQDDFAEGPVLAPGIADCLPVSARARRGAARRYARMVAAKAADYAALPVPERPVTAGRLRVGFLSSDFHNHPTMQLFRGVLESRDRSRMEWLAYSYGPDDGSDLRQVAMRSFDRFREVGGLPSAEVARMIAGDGIDILVDLKGYTGSARPDITALRPAPVQVNYLGYPGTMGADFVDYIVADRTLIPPGAEAWFDERIVFMPHCYQPNDVIRDDGLESPSRADLGLPAAGFVFCSFNATYKIEPGIFSVWMEILLAVPGSVLWLQADDGAARENLRREAASRGVPAERLVFAATLPKAHHLARLACADLFLDTHFVNAHTTASDAIRAGLPLLTCPGEGFSSRVAASVLHAAGLPDLVSGSFDEYRSTAIGLARNPGLHAEVRRRVQRARLESPLFDAVAYARALETAFELMRARPPASFSVLAGRGDRVPLR